MVVGAYLLVVSCGTYIFYRQDKMSAQTGGWRTPENVLHAAELAGGWPGAFIAQQMLRHKSSKVTYQVSYWMIVLFHQFLAAEYLSGWKVSRRAWSLLSGLLSSGPQD